MNISDKLYNIMESLVATSCLVNIIIVGGGGSQDRTGDLSVQGRATLHNVSIVSEKIRLNGSKVIVNLRLFATIGFKKIPWRF